MCWASGWGPVPNQVGGAFILRFTQEAIDLQQIDAVALFNPDPRLINRGRTPGGGLRDP